MNKKKLVAGLLASASVLGVCLSGGTALAAVHEEETTVGIGFGEHKPGGPEGEDLQIAWLPKAFDFGSGHTPDASGSQDYDATGAAKKYVVISDARAEGGSDKWELSAGLSELKTADGNVLTSATLGFDATMMGYSSNKAPESDPSPVIAPGARTATTPLASVSLTQKAAATKVLVDNGSGVSSYKGLTALEMTNIKLTVPGGAALDNKTYTGKVTWSLDDLL